MISHTLSWHRVLTHLAAISRSRCFSTSPRSPSPSPNHSIYISRSTNPYFNLTFEDWLFRHKPPDEPLLFIYRDDPCVVIGRNQNPWKEVNMPESRRTGIPVIRRRSGGGTVYHDLGNTNFSIHLPRPSFDRHVTAQIVLRAVRSLGIDAHVNDRNDICVGKDKMSSLRSAFYETRQEADSLRILSLYVSGSAYKIVNKRAYHHGTMLISTRLDTLGDILHSNKDTMVTRGVASVRSPVRNLQQFSSSVTHEAFAEAVVWEFKKEYSINDVVHIVEEHEEITNVEYIRSGMAELPSWEWAYGQTPEFTYTISHSFTWGDVTAKIDSKHGLILACALQASNTSPEGPSPLSLEDLGKSFEGERYGFVGDELAHREPNNDVGAWLNTIMTS